jgi:protocatechuate 4,5-dioxygenase alpha chain
MRGGGGRAAEGNRHRGEDGDAPPQHQPQGAAGKNKGA